MIQCLDLPEPATLLGLEHLNEWRLLVVAFKDALGKLLYRAAKNENAY